MFYILPSTRLYIHFISQRNATNIKNHHHRHARGDHSAFKLAVASNLLFVFYLCVCVLHICDDNRSQECVVARCVCIYMVFTHTYTKLNRHSLYGGSSFPEHGCFCCVVKKKHPLVSAKIQV